MFTLPQDSQGALIVFQYSHPQDSTTFLEPPRSQTRTLFETVACLPDPASEVPPVAERENRSADRARTFEFGGHDEVGIEMDIGSVHALQYHEFRHCVPPLRLSDGQFPVAEEAPEYIGMAYFEYSNEPADIVKDGDCSCAAGSPSEVFVKYALALFRLNFAHPQKQRETESHQKPHKVADDKDIPPPRLSNG
jgi:hypothetical protein